MRRNKIEFENLNPDEQQVHLENLKLKILECKKNIENNTVNLGSYLVSVKEQLPHGEFGKWIEDNVGFSERTARRYMKVYQFREDFMICETIEESDKKEKIMQGFSNGQLMELSKLSKKDAYEFINEDNVEELQDLSMAKLSKKVKEFKQSKKLKTDSNDRFETEKETPPATITTEIVIQTDVNKIFTELCILNGELRNRTGVEEDLETTLIGKYYAKEITHQEFIDVVAKNKLNLPIFFYKEALDEYLDRFDYYPEYQKYDNNIDTKADRTYYSLFDKELEWQEVTRCWDDNDENAIDWSKSNSVDNGTYQIAHAYIDTSMYLCIYKNYILQGTYRDGNMSDIDMLGTYDRRNLPVENMKDIELLYKKLEKQMKLLEQRQAIRQEKEHAEYVKRQAKQKKYDDALREWKECYQPYSMGKYSFSDIYNENGEIKNYKLWREMSDFVREEKQKKYDKWKDYDFGGMFGGGTSLAIKEEDKPTYKQFYRKLAMEFHPDKCKDDGHAMQLINDLKSNWGI